MALDERAPSPGRERQRRRTSRAIATAAMELLAEGRTPTVAEIAERADVSRRTVHMHFPTLEQLLADAALGLASEQLMEADLAPSRSGDDAEERVAALARAIARHHNKLEHLGRTIIRLTIDAPARPGAGPRRGGRRVDWIETALEPAREQLTPAEFNRLGSALATVIGWEAMLALRDVRSLSPRQAEDVTVWSARALVRAALSESETGRQRTQTARRSPQRGASTDSAPAAQRTRNKRSA